MFVKMVVFGGNMRNLSKKMKIVLGTEALLIVVALILFAIPLSHYSYKGDEFSSEYGIPMQELLGVTEPGFYFDNSMEIEKELKTVVSPSTDLRFGSYDVILKYLTSDHNNTYTCSSEYSTVPVILGRQNAGLLEIEKPDTFMTIHLNSPLNVKGYQVTFNSTDNGYLYVYGLEIQETNWWKFFILITIIIISIFLDVFLFLSESGNIRARNDMLIVIALALFATLPMMDPYLGTGHDIDFHLGRIEGLAVSIRNRQIPSRISSAWLDGKGYAASIFYADIFLLLPAILRILGCSIQMAFKVYLFVINLATAWISLFCFGKLIKSRLGTIAASVAFMLSPYRLICIYSRFALGEYTALTFYPLILWGMLELYKDDDKKSFTGRVKRVLPFAIGLTGVVCCHVLSGVMVAIFVIAFALINFKKTFTPKVLIDYVLTGCIVILLNVWYLLPFVQVMKDGIQAVSEHLDGRFRSNGTYLWQLLSLFPKDGYSMSIEEAVPINRSAEMTVSVGPAFIAVLVYVLLRLQKHFDKSSDKWAVKAADALCGFGAFTIFMATPYFPWDAVKQMSYATNLVTKNIQFPFRFLGITMLCLSILIGIMFDLMKDSEGVIKNYAIPFVVAMIACCAVSASSFMTSYGESGVYILLPDGYGNSSVMGAEYLPEGTSKDYEDFNEPSATDGVEILDWRREKGSIYVAVNNATSEEASVSVPFLCYRGYRAYDADNGISFNTVKDGNGFVSFTVPSGYQGEVSVFYREPILWRLCELVSVLTLAGLVFAVIKGRKRN